MSKTTKILFLAANPVDTPRIRIDEEIRAIDDRIQLAEFRELFDVTYHSAVRVGDLQSLLMRHKPNIVHFSGHGAETHEIILVDPTGKGRRVPVAAIGGLFAILNAGLQCVVLNACYTDRQAVEIAKHVPCVIGVSKTLGDDAAIAFAASFYLALGFGKSIKVAFDLGRNQIALEFPGQEDQPVLLGKDSACGEVVFKWGEKLDLLAGLALGKLGEGGSSRRSEAALQLGLLGDEAAVPLLEKRWQMERDPTVRYWLAIALGRIEGKNALQTLNRIRSAEADQFALSGVDEALGKKGGLRK
jgi:hypothetical protein